MGWGDMTGDGYPELAVVTDLGDYQVFANVEGQVEDAPYWTPYADTSAVGDRAYTVAVAWGDADSDGDLDLAIGMRGNAGRNLVFENYEENGEQRLRQAWVDPVSHETADLAWGDVDGDGDLDLAAAVYAEPDFVYLNDGSPLAETADPWGSLEGDYSAEDWTAQSLAWGDVDNDGDLDLAVGYAWQNVDLPEYVVQAAGDEFSWLGVPNHVYLNHGGFLDPWPIWSSTSEEATMDLAWGDMEGDGDLDLAVVNHAGPVEVFENVDGILSLEPVCGFGDGDDHMSVAWGDANNDEYLDLAVGVYDGPNKLYLYDPESKQLVDSGWQPAGDPTYDVAWADVDADGDLDLAVGNSWDQETTVFENRDFLYLNQDGILDDIPAQTIGELHFPTRSIDWGDIDSDGDPDLAIGVWSGQKRVYENQAGVLQPQPVWVSTDSDLTTRVAWGDADGDGDADLAAANVTLFTGGTRNDLYYNDGGELQALPSWQPDSRAQTHALAWGDYNSDGLLDLTVGNKAGQVETYRGRRGITSGQIYRQPLLAIGLHTDPASRSHDATGLLAGADDYAGSIIRASGLITIPYTLHDPAGTPYAQIQGYYSLNGTDWVTATATAQTRTIDLASFSETPDRIAYWSFDQAMPDSSADQQDSRWIFENRVDGSLAATWTGKLAPPYTYPPFFATPNPGSGWFPEEGATVAVEHDQRLSGEDGLSISAWVYVADPSRRQGVIGKTTEALDSGYMLGIEDGQLTVQLFGDDGVEYSVRGGEVFTDTWMHVGMTWEQGGDLVGYMDGFEIGRVATQDAGIAQNSAPLQMGQFSHDPILLPLAGGIDEVQLFTRGLSAEEMGKLAFGINSGPAEHVYVWNTTALDSDSGFFGLSNNVRFRLKAYPSQRTQANAIADPYRPPFISAQTYPFRVRGIQPRVVDEAGVPQSDALVFRINKEETVRAWPVGIEAGEAYFTDSNGYLAGNDVLRADDKLVALAPITATHAYILYHTSDAAARMSGKQIEPSIVQTLTVSADNPLYVFNLDVSLEWDARNDLVFMNDLEDAFREASDILYDITDGQVALGVIRVFHAKENWLGADVVIRASNNQRPRASLGGVVMSTVDDPLDDPDRQKLENAYSPGQVRMGPIWDPYGLNREELGDDLAQRSGP